MVYGMSNQLYINVVNTLPLVCNFKSFKTKTNRTLFLITVTRDYQRMNPQTGEIPPLAVYTAINGNNADVKTAVTGIRRHV